MAMLDVDTPLVGRDQRRGRIITHTINIASSCLCQVPALRLRNLVLCFAFGLS